MVDVGQILNLVVTATPIIGQEVTEAVALAAQLKEFLASKGYDSDTVAITSRIAEDARRQQIAHDEANG